MSIEFKQTEQLEQEDPQVEAALRQFRQSVRGWSDSEFTRARTISPKSRAWRFLHAPLLGWGLAAAVVVSAVTIPVEVHQRREAIAALAAARQTQQPLVDTELQVASSMNSMNSMTDEELLSHVDTDIAQATPDAMEPLASLMSSDTATR